MQGELWETKESLKLKKDTRDVFRDLESVVQAQRVRQRKAFILLKANEGKERNLSKEIPLLSVDGEVPVETTKSDDKNVAPVPVPVIPPAVTTPSSPPPSK